MKAMWLSLALVLSAHGADDAPAPPARGHLLAAYCVASPAEEAKQIAGIYREIIPVAAPPGSYTTVAFTGGYIGLAGNKDKLGGDTVNFSIWGRDAAEVAPADPRFGTTKTRQFDHEGTGWAGRLSYPWKVGERYHVYVQVTHMGGQTIYSAWFGSVAKSEWVLAGRTRKGGTHFLGHAGGFLEHAGTQNAEVPRSTGYGPAWVHNGAKWLPCTKAEASVKDPGNARFSQRDNVIYLELGLGLKSTQGTSATFPLKAGESPPALPEEVGSWRPAEKSAHPPLSPS